MMVKKKTTVQTAEEEKKKSDFIVEGTEDQPIPVDMIENPPKPAEAKQPQAKPPIEIPQSVLKQAKRFGIDLGQIVDWAQRVEQRLEMADANFQVIQKSFNKLEPLVKLSEQVAQAQTNPQPPGATAQPQGFNPASILQLITPFLGGGGGDSELNALAKKALMSQINMGTAITNAVVSKIVGKATSDVARVVTSGE